MKRFLYKSYILIKNLILSVLFMAILLNILIFFVPLFKEDTEKANYGVLNTFYNEEKDSADVVFVGSSALYRYVSTVQLYEKYGFTSLNYCSAAMDIHTTAGVIDEIIDYQNPKVIVIEMRNYINNCDNYMKNLGYTDTQLLQKEFFFKSMIKNIPLSFNRAKIIHDTVDSLQQDEFEWQFEYYNSHNQWKNLKLKDVKNFFKWRLKPDNVMYDVQENLTYKGEEYKGTIGVKRIRPQKSSDYSNYEKREKISGEWLDVLMNICEKAKTCGTEILFITTPYPIDKQSVAYENTMGDILSEQGLNYINFNRLYKELNINFSTDFYDNKHTNIGGMVKFSNYIGKYLVKNYGIEKTKLTAEQKAEWDKATEKWIKNERTPALEKINSYVSKLNENDN